MRLGAGRGAQLLLALAVCLLLGCGDDDDDGSGVDAGAPDGAISEGGAGLPDGFVLVPDDAGGHEDASTLDAGGSSSDAGDDAGTDAGPPEPCGDGVVDEDDDETCDIGIDSGDGECPDSCDDDDACTIDTLAHEDTCQAECEHEDITEDEDGDGCCLPGSTGEDDDDCPPTRLDVSLDDETISSELGTKHVLTIKLEADDGFEGDVQLEATAVDEDDNPVTTWTLALDDDSLSVPEDGEITAELTVTIPTVREVLAATVKVEAQSDAMAGESEASASFELLDRITFPMSLASGECVYPPAGTVQARVGTVIRWLNTETDPLNRITIHVEGAANGCGHEPDPGTAPGGAYQCTLAGSPGDAFRWYCHAPGPMVIDRTLQVVP